MDEHTMKPKAAILNQWSRDYWWASDHYVVGFAICKVIFIRN